MATYQADQLRAVAIELRNKAADLYVAVLPIFRAASQWTLNSLDPELPAPFAVRTQVTAYKALKISALQLNDWVTALLKAMPDDGLTYPPPPLVSGMIEFNQVAFEVIVF